MIGRQARAAICRQARAAIWRQARAETSVPKAPGERIGTRMMRMYGDVRRRRKMTVVRGKKMTGVPVRRRMKICADQTSSNYA